MLLGRARGYSRERALKEQRRMIKTQMSRRGWLAASGAAFGASALAACGADAGPGAQTKASGKVVFMSQGTDPNDEARYKPLVEQFNAKASGVTIDHIQGDPGGSAVAAQGKVIALAAAGTPPDIFWTHAYVAPNLAKLGLTCNINPFNKCDKDIELTNLFEASVKDYDFDGKQSAMPRAATTMVTIINKELFHKNGVPLPRDNWTWVDFLKAAQSMSKG